MDTGTWIALASLLLGGGLFMAALRYLFAHARKHQEIDDRLDHGLEHFEKNDEDHDRITEKLDEVVKGNARIEGFLSRRLNGGGPLEE